jgi:imidazolonepropionase-like amidohydrolase
MSAAGMSPYEILVTGTRNVGEYFSSKDNFGTIEVGKRADLILVDQNPLDDISNLKNHSGVMVAGRWLSKDFISEKLSQIEASYKNQKED